MVDFDDLLDRRLALDIIFAVPQLAVQPRAAALEARAVLVGGDLVAQGARQIRAGPQRAEVEAAAHGVRAVELDVVGVVLLALHHPVAVGIPGRYMPFGPRQANSSARLASGHSLRSHSVSPHSCHSR